MTDKTIDLGNDLDKNMAQEQVMNILDELDSTELEDTDKYVMKELLRGKSNDLVFKTELNMFQIRGIVRLLTIDKIMKAQSETNKEKANNILESVPDYMTSLLMKLLVSKDRQGRKEFIEAWVGKENKELEGINKWIGR